MHVACRSPCACISMDSPTTGIVRSDNSAGNRNRADNLRTKCHARPIQARMDSFTFEGFRKQNCPPLIREGREISKRIPPRGGPRTTPRTISTSLRSGGPPNFKGQFRSVVVRPLTRADGFYAALISTVRDLDAAFFGSASVSNPSLYSARTFPVSTVLGRENDRKKEP